MEYESKHLNFYNHENAWSLQVVGLGVWGGICYYKDPFLKSRASAYYEEYPEAETRKWSWFKAWWCDMFRTGAIRIYKLEFYGGINTEIELTNKGYLEMKKLDL